MSVWSLNYNGTEKTFPAWGIRDDCTISLVSKGKWVVTFTTVEDYDPSGGPQFTFEEPVMIYYNRTLSGGSFSGGTVYFYGWVGDPVMTNDGGRQAITYEFYDIWRYLERQIFRQVRNAATNYTPATGDWTYGTPQFLCEIYLGEIVNLAGQTVALMTNGAECSEILSWLNESFNATRRGNAYAGSAGSIVTTDDIVNFWGRPGAEIWPPPGGLPGSAVDSGHGNAVMDPQQLIPVSRVQVITCAEALINMLRWSPSVTVHRDWTSASTPPLTTLHFRDQLGANALPLVTINLTTAQEREIKTKSEKQRLVPGVVIEYRRVSTVNGQPYLAYVLDTWPGSVTQFTPKIVFQFIELAGAQVTQVQAAVEVNPTPTPPAPRPRRSWPSGPSMNPCSRITQTSARSPSTTPASPSSKWVPTPPSTPPLTRTSSCPKAASLPGCKPSW
jgi:hypothetical protein